MSKKKKLIKIWMLSLWTMTLLQDVVSWDMGQWGNLAGSNVLLCQHRLSRLVSKGWAPRTKGSHLIHPCKQVTEVKNKSNPYMVIFNFIGYFTLVLHDIFPPQCYITFLIFRFLRFYLSARPSLPPCCFIRTQAYTVFFWSSSLLQHESSS
jgi:hypothetical protein